MNKYWLDRLLEFQHLIQTKPKGCYKCKKKGDPHLTLCPGVGGGGSNLESESFISIGKCGIIWHATTRIDTRIMKIHFCVAYHSKSSG